MEQAQVYTFTRGLRRARERYTVLAIMLPAMLLGFLFLSPLTRTESLGFKLGLGFFLLVVLGLVFYFSSSRVLRRLSELSVSIFPDRLERVSPENREVYSWKDTKRVDAIEYPSGELASIKLSFTGEHVIYLFGFDDMEACMRQIEAAIPKETVVRRKRARLNWDNPLSTILAGLITMVVILAVQQLGGRAFYIFYALFFLAFGLYSLRYRPISRSQGTKWRASETVTGVLLTGMGLLLLALELLSG